MAEKSSRGGRAGRWENNWRPGCKGGKRFLGCVPIQCGCACCSSTNKSGYFADYQKRSRIRQSVNVSSPERGSLVVCARGPDINGADSLAMLIRMKPAILQDGQRSRLVLTPDVLHPRSQTRKLGPSLWVACRRDILERLSTTKGEATKSQECSTHQQVDMSVFCVGPRLFWRLVNILPIR